VAEVIFPISLNDIKSTIPSWYPACFTPNHKRPAFHLTRIFLLPCLTMHHSTLIALLAAPFAVLASPIIAERQTVGSLDAAFKAKGKKYVGVATDQ